ncbi:unnamed protein product [Tetraodon nigroviridis]|uniref:Chromosome undetermined SCAF14702, whole genome shotgun sequence n=1 Tax=Tetraodon nigroviridis TaxID=99883 RepID=Q4S919_TETNG|nr:unnamed protein product [Tetraodon nigroviridis]
MRLKIFDCTTRIVTGNNLHCLLSRRQQADINPAFTKDQDQLSFWKINFVKVVVGLLAADAQIEMKKVVGDNATLPCHHQFPTSESLDIEWLLQKPNAKQKVLITFFGERVYTNEAMGSEASRLSFAGEYLSGDASLLISDLLLTDSGEYSCKVKSGGKITWNRVNLIVLVKPSKPRCWMDGKLLEGSDVKLSCKSSDGSDPIHYKWERVLDKGKSLGKLPNLALIGKEPIPPPSGADLKNPEIVTLRNLTMDSAGVYRCTASNDVGEENCTVEVTMQCELPPFAPLSSTDGWSQEDAEAPKAKLVKPNSLSSSRSGSSRSGASSTQSMSPPSYTSVVPPKTPEPPVTPKYTSRNLSGPTPPTLMVPAQTKAFQTV